MLFRSEKEVNSDRVVEVVCIGCGLGIVEAGLGRLDFLFLTWAMGGALFLEVVGEWVVDCLDLGLAVGLGRWMRSTERSAGAWSWLSRGYGSDLAEVILDDGLIVSVVVFLQRLAVVRGALVLVPLFGVAHDFVDRVHVGVERVGVGAALSEWVGWLGLQCVRLACEWAVAGGRSEGGDVSGTELGEDMEPCIQLWEASRAVIAWGHCDFLRLLLQRSNLWKRMVNRLCCVCAR